MQAQQMGQNWNHCTGDATWPACCVRRRIWSSDVAQQFLRKVVPIFGPAPPPDVPNSSSTVTLTVPTSSPAPSGPPTPVAPVSPPLLPPYTSPCHTPATHMDACQTSTSNGPPRVTQDQGFHSVVYTCWMFTRALLYVIVWAVLYSVIDETINIYKLKLIRDSMDGIYDHVFHLFALWSVQAPNTQALKLIPVHFRRIIRCQLPPRSCYWNYVFWHSLCGVEWTSWTTGRWQYCRSLNVVRSIPTLGTTISRLFCM